MRGGSLFCFRERECEMTDLSKIETSELIAEIVRREQPNGAATTGDTATVADRKALQDAIDQCRWGNIDLCGHYLIRAIPGLWPLGKILGA